MHRFFVGSSSRLVSYRHVFVESFSKVIQIWLSEELSFILFTFQRGIWVERILPTPCNILLVSFISLCLQACRLWLQFFLLRVVSNFLYGFSVVIRTYTIFFGNLLHVFVLILLLSHFCATFFIFHDFTN